MPSHDPSEPSEVDLALLALVTEALGERPEGSATLRQRWVQEGGWVFDVQPREPAAAAFSVVFTGDDVVSVTVGNIWFEVFSVRAAADVDHLREIATAVFAGRVEESTYKSKAWGRIYLDDGPLRVGSVHLPWPKRNVECRRYAPYA